MKRVVVWIVAGHDPSHDFTAGASQKERGISVLIEGVFPAQKFFALDHQRRHPGRIVLVNLPGKLDECVPVRAGFDLDDLERRHEIGIPSRVGSHARPK